MVQISHDIVFQFGVVNFDCAAIPVSGFRKTPIQISNLKIIDELTSIDSCITSNKQYLYISGGYDIYDNY